MISDPSLIHYACIAKGTTILAEFNSKDAALGAIAAKCLEKTPPFHATFTHTVRSKTYTFLIDEPYVYFLISDDKLENSEGLAFLKSVRDAFVNDFKGEKNLEKLSSHCFHGEFDPVFGQLLGQRIGESGAIRGREQGLKKMKKRLVEKVIGRRNVEKEIDENRGNGIGLSTEFSPIIHKVWKKQMWIVFSLDLIACAILFVVWLWICSGLKCMES